MTPAWPRRGCQTALIHRRLYESGRAGCDLVLGNAAPFLLQPLQYGKGRPAPGLLRQFLAGRRGLKSSAGKVWDWPRVVYQSNRQYDILI